MTRAATTQAVCCALETSRCPRTVLITGRRNGYPCSREGAGSGEAQHPCTVANGCGMVKPVTTGQARMDARDAWAFPSVLSRRSIRDMVRRAGRGSLPGWASLCLMAVAPPPVPFGRHSTRKATMACLMCAGVCVGAGLGRVDRSCTQAGWVASSRARHLESQLCAQTRCGQRSLIFSSARDVLSAW